MNTAADMIPGVPYFSLPDVKRVAALAFQYARTKEVLAALVDPLRLQFPQMTCLDALDALVEIEEIPDARYDAWSHEQACNVVAMQCALCIQLFARVFDLAQDWPCEVEAFTNHLNQDSKLWIAFVQAQVESVGGLVDLRDEVVKAQGLIAPPVNPAVRDAKPMSRTLQKMRELTDTDPTFVAKAVALMTRLQNANADQGVIADDVGLHSSTLTRDPWFQLASKFGEGGAVQRRPAKGKYDKRIDRSDVSETDE